MDISNFLNPVEESLETAESEELPSETLLEHLIATASTTGDVYNNDEDDSPEPAPLPKPSDALNAVRLLISYMEGQDVSRVSLLRCLERLKRDLESEL